MQLYKELIDSHNHAFDLSTELNWTELIQDRKAKRGVLKNENDFSKHCV